MFLTIVAQAILAALVVFFIAAIAFGIAKGMRK
jgi:hypothetical protein